MFLGSYKPSFDAKSRRLALPKKLRQNLKGNEIVISAGFESCIFGFDLKSWDIEVKKQLSQPLTQKGARSIRRFIFSDAEHLRLDSQGRFILPDNLRWFAKIEKPIVIGAGDHFEIWDEDIWKAEKKKLEEEVLL